MYCANDTPKELILCVMVLSASADYLACARYTVYVIITLRGVIVVCCELFLWLMYRIKAPRARFTFSNY